MQNIATLASVAKLQYLCAKDQKTVGLLIVQDGFSWCFSWCLQSLNVDSCKILRSSLFSLSLSFSSKFLFLANSARNALAVESAASMAQAMRRPLHTRSYQRKARCTYTFRAATAFPMSDDVRTAFSQAALEYDQVRFLRKMGYLQGLQDHFCDSCNATQPRITKRINTRNLRFGYNRPSMAVLDFMTFTVICVFAWILTS